MSWKRTAIFGAAIFSCVSCDDGHLRGSVDATRDGKTYLVIADGNNCAEIKVDGEIWPHAIGQSGAINPGEHSIDCNGEIRFTIPAGTTFKFDYWGP